MMQRWNSLFAAIAVGVASFLTAPSHAQTFQQFTTCGTAPRTLSAGSAALIGVDLNGSLCISGTISTTVTFPTIGAAVPATGIYNGINVGGTLRGQTGLGLGSTFSPTVAIVDASGNQITSFGGANASVGSTGAAVPASATYIGIISAGNLTGWTGAVTQSGTWTVTNAAETTKVIGTVRNADGAGVLYVSDPCSTAAKTTLPITLATAAVKVIAVGASSKKIYVCHLQLTNNAADSIALFEATTATTCVTSPVAVVGAGTSVATAATGYNFSANGGINTGNGGYQIHVTTVNNNDLCIAQSAATQLTGTITYVTQ